MSETNIVMVTGGTGFIGRNTIRPLLRKGFEVHVVSSSGDHRYDPAPELRIHQCDLFDTMTVRRLVEMVRPTHLLHLAWGAIESEECDAPHHLDWVQASLGLLRVFAESGGKRAVLAGTSAEYDNGESLCDEVATLLNPSSLYGVCKGSLRQIAFPFAQSAEISLAWGRLFGLYGPGDDERRPIPTLTSSLLQGGPVPCPHGEHERDFLHVYDAGDALVELLDSEVNGPVNIASGRPVTLREIAENLAEITGGNDVLKNEETVAAADAPAQITAATSRLNDEVGWRPALTLKEGLRSMVKSFERRAATRAA